MSKIQLLIEVDEKEYENIKRGCIMASTLRNAKQLPKEHGRLIDADEIIRLTNEIEAEGVEDREDRLYYLFLKTVLKDAPTIIEADRESEE